MSDNTDRTDQPADSQTDDSQQADQRTDQQTDATDALGEKGQAALKAERDARRKAERDLKSALSRLDELESAGKSEDEKRASELTKAQERAEAAERRLREATGRTAIYDAATKANAISLGAVWALAKDGLEYDEDGEPTNVDTVLAGLQKKEAQLFRHSGGRGDGGAGTETTREVKPGFGRLVNAYETTSKTAAR